MLYIIGTGLNDFQDISLRSIEILKTCDKIYRENYTCTQADSFEQLEKIIDKKIILANRLLIEEETMEIINFAQKYNVAILVSGTPLFATTHTDLLIQAKKYNIQVKIIHNVSIALVKGCYGLYSYNFGKTVSICCFTETWKPISFYDSIYKNYINNLHTLCLLDIKVNENKFMSATEALRQLLYAEEQTKYGLITPETKIFVVCRFATDTEKVYYNIIDKLLQEDFGEPLHSIIFPAKLSLIESEFINYLYQ